MVIDLLKEAQVQQLFLIFQYKAESSVEVALQDINIACNRGVKYHKIYSSGIDVELKNVGIPSRSNVLVKLKQLCQNWQLISSAKFKF